MTSIRSSAMSFSLRLHKGCADGLGDVPAGFIVSFTVRSGADVRQRDLGTLLGDYFIPALCGITAWQTLNMCKQGTGVPFCDDQIAVNFGAWTFCAALIA